MSSGRALVPIVMLALQPVCVFGRNFVFPPDPIGEEVYRAHLFVDLAPIAIIAFGAWLGWSLHEAHRKSRDLPADDAWSYDI